MLVIIFPVSYLIIALTSSAGRLPIITQVVGIIMSMLFSLFINMQAPLIANANNITIRETYAVYNVKPIIVFIGQCLFHIILSLPLILLGIVVIFLLVGQMSILYFLLWLILSFIFLSSFSIFLGMMLKNPQVASPIINVIYMLAISITPLYLGSDHYKALYLLNPLTHIINLFYCIFNKSLFCSAALSISILLILSFIMSIVIYNLLRTNSCVEKLTIIN